MMGDSAQASVKLRPPSLEKKVPLSGVEYSPQHAEQPASRITEWLTDNGADALHVINDQNSFLQKVFVSFSSLSEFRGAFSRFACLAPRLLSMQTIQAGNKDGSPLGQGM